MKWKKKGGSSIFFICAFTLAFFMFSIANSAISSQNKRLQKYDGKTNKAITIKCKEGISQDTITDLLKDDKVTIELLNYVFNKDYILTTHIKNDGFIRLGDLRYGEYLSKEDYSGEEAVGVFSSAIKSTDHFNISYYDDYDVEKNIEIKEIGKTFDVEAFLDIPNKLFFKLSKTNDVISNNFIMVFSGEEEEINNAIDKFKGYIINRDPESVVDVYNYNINDIEMDGRGMLEATMIIIFITILNAISISELWVKENRKELIVRKVCGAKNIELVKIHFKRLSLLSAISVLIAIGLQLAVELIFKGVFLNTDIRININNFLFTFMLSIVVAFISSIPSLIYITKVEPASMLRGE